MNLLEVLALPVEEAAPALLGRRLVSDLGKVRTAVIITEVEAYGGRDDPASHAAKGQTARNLSMFSAPGVWYVYRAYGLHWCMNLVTGPRGEASAVLIRGGDPVEGLDEMERRRSRSDAISDGPGKLTQALGVNAALDGMSAVVGPVRIEGEPLAGEIETTPRIGISKAVDVPWRFVLK